jgi:glycosyltransferase involved in cell wall biosynthesis
MPDRNAGRIRVLHLGSPTGLYGAERWILALARHLPAARVDSWVGVIKDAPGLEAPLCTHAAQLGLRAVSFEAHGRLSLAAIGQIRRFIRGHQIHILHTHGYKTDFVGCLAARGTSCKTMATPHGWGASPGIRMRLYEALDRVMLQFADAVVPLSAELLEGLSRLPRMDGRLHFIPNGVDLMEVDAAGEPSQLLESRRASGEVIIGYVGRLDRGKRLDTLIRAFHLLPLHRKYLCVIGEGPERRRLEQLAAAILAPGQVDFLGFREDRIRLLRSFDLFVLPSEHEGMPRCLMEAMSVGVAAVAADIPGCRELMDGNANGLVFRPGDHADLSRQMLRLGEDPDLRKQLARKGREHVRRRYSAQAMADSYFALYERVLLPLRVRSEVVGI